MAPRFDRVLLNHIEKQNNEKAQSILENADDPCNLVDSFGNTLLHYAARYGNLDMTKYLIESGSSIDAQNNDGKTPLILAVEHCKTIDVAEVLLDANADIRIRDTDGNSPVTLAIDSVVNHELSRRFLKKLEIQFSYDYEEVTNVLVDAGCDLIQAMYMECAEVTRMLLKRGYSCVDKDEDPDECFWRDYDDDSPLHLAVNFMHLENVKLLLEHGANVNELYYGLTPAFYLDVTHKDVNLVLDILESLLEGGAQMYVPDHGDNDSIQMGGILSNGTKDVIRLLRKYDFGLTKHALKDSSTVLHALARNENPGIFAELPKERFDVNALDGWKCTPLWWAMHNPSSVKWLLENGADPDARNDSDGMTALMKPFFHVEPGDRRVHVESVELLLLHYAGFDIVDSDGTTIFDAAVKSEDGKRCIEPVLALLAMTKASRIPIPEWVDEKIRAHEMLRARFDFYARKVEKMKSTIVHQSITLHHLLTGRPHKLIAYMRNKEFILKLSRLSIKCGLTSFYHKHLRRCLTNAKDMAEVRGAAEIALCRMTGLCNDAKSVVIDNIISYLDYADWMMLHFVC